MISDADAAFDASNWSESRRSYDAALRIKPNDRYAQGRLSRISKAESKAASMDQNLERDDGAERSARLEADRLREEQELESSLEAELFAQEAELKRRMDDAAALEEEREAERRQ